MEDEKIINKIRAILAKTVENGCSEEEAASAVKFAAKLMAEHGIEMESINMEPKEYSKVSSDFGRGDRDWQATVGTQVAILFGNASYWDEDADCMVFFGKVGTKIAAEVFQFLIKEMRRIAIEFKAYKLTSPKAFYKGMALSVCKRLREREQTVEEEWALMRAEDARKEMYENSGEDLRPTKHRKQKDSADFYLGIFAGTVVPLGIDKVLE